MTKLIIQIPCLNEEETLPQVVRDLPREVEGVDVVELLVIDDGSTDRTAEVARELGVEHVLSMPQRLGLARGFSEGLRYATHLGADIVVNTDGDNQYAGEDVRSLVAPIVAGKAQIVVGARDIWGHAEFPLHKKVLQTIGSRLVGYMAGIHIEDATSGFRAYSREAALKITVHSRFSYTLETLIQADAKQLAVQHVPVRTNPKTRESRLFRSLWEYLLRSGTTMLRVFTTYRPLKVFLIAGGVLSLAGIGIGIRFLYYYYTAGASGMVQSLVLAAILILLGGNCVLMGMLADANATTRLICEELLYLHRKDQADQPETADTGPH
jgi:glycosyltransferase involved in cell wall biosynthesis